MNSKVVKNAGWIIGCKLLKSILTLLVTILTARYLGVANYGLINYAAGIVSFVSPIMSLGLDATSVYEIVNHPDKEGVTVGTVLVLTLLSGVCCIAGVICFSAVTNQGEKETVIVCGLYSLQLIFHAMEMIQYWFHAHLLAKYSSLAMVVSYMIVTFVQAVLIFKKASVYWFALSHSIDYCAIAFILFCVYKQQGGQRFSFSITRAKSLLSVSRFYIVSSLMVTVFNNTDRVMLKLMVGNEATGVYAAAHSCAGMTSFVFIAIIDSMRPTLFNYRKNNENTFQHGITGLYSIIIFFSLAQSLLLSLFSETVINLIYGAEYQGAASVLSIAVWFTTFSHLGVVRNIWILAGGYQKYLWKINLSGALMNVILNYTLIPDFGAAGAAIASVISQIFTNVIVGFIIPAIRPNNYLMMKALNPRYLNSAFMRLFKAGKRR